MRLVLMGLLLICTACASSPQGESVDIGNAADVGSTALALTVVQGAAEANPLGLALIPLKFGAGWFLDETLEDCSERATAASIMNTGSWAFVANNLALVAGASVAPVVGIAGGALYWIFKEDLEPDSYTCTDPVDPNWIRGGPNNVSPDLVIPI